MYEELTLENAHLDYIQVNHYIDEGCLCKACFIKRQQISTQIINGQQVTDRVIHSEAKNELIVKRVEKANYINKNNASLQPIIRGGRKDFKSEMNNIVRNNR